MNIINNLIFDIFCRKMLTFSSRCISDVDTRHSNAIFWKHSATMPDWLHRSMKDDCVVGDSMHIWSMMSTAAFVSSFNQNSNINTFYFSNQHCRRHEFSMACLDSHSLQPGFVSGGVGLVGGPYLYSTLQVLLEDYRIMAEARGPTLVETRTFSGGAMVPRSLTCLLYTSPSPRD